MPGHPDLAPLAAQYAFFIDQESAALDALELPAVHALLADHVEQAAGLALLVGEQLEGKLELLLELLVRRERVGRDADDLGSRLAELRIQVAEFHAFPRAAGGIVARVEVDDELATGLSGQLPVAAPGRGQREVRNLAVELDGLVGHRHALSGSRIASRLRLSQKSMNSSRSAAMWMRVGTCTTM